MSFNSLVKSTVLLGSSTAVTTLIGILRVKALAILLGPAGVGLLGALASLASAGTSLAALGSDTSGTRRLALERGDPQAVARVRQALLFVAIVHGALAIAAFFAIRGPLSTWLLGGQDYAFEVGLLGIAVALSLLAGLQIAQLQGLGRVRDIARINILSSAIGTVLGLAAIWTWGLSGLILLILAQPALAALLALCETGPLARDDLDSGAGRRRLYADWRLIVVQGAPYMLSFVMLALVPLAIRAIVIADLGLAAAGHFHAAWTMSVIYIGFLLSAMSADYFPRLTALGSDSTAANELVNDQAELGLAIGGVVLILMLASAPMLVPLLYSTAFQPAVEIVQWQAFGNLMKIAGWPVAFMAMARGRAVQFFLVELTWSLLLLALVWIGLPYFGLAATGMAFAGACCGFLVLQTVVASVAFGFVWERRVLYSLATFAGAGLLVLLASRHSVWLQAATGGVLAALLGLSSLRLILERTHGGGRIAAVIRSSLGRLGWPLPGLTPAGKG